MENMPDTASTVHQQVLAWHVVVGYPDFVVLSFREPEPHACAAAAHMSLEADRSWSQVL